jgi:transcriptional regulator with XRE-family HTH domain
MSQGMSLRALAKELGLAAHGTLVDYEHGRRIPPEDLIIGCERVFRISDGALRDLRDKALAERADQKSDLLLTDREPGPGPGPDSDPDPEPGPDPEPDSDPDSLPAAGTASSRRRRRVVWSSAGIVALLGIGLGVGVWRSGTTTARATAPPSSRATAPPSTLATSALSSSTVVAQWGICWGGQAGSVQPSDVVTYGGADTLQITVAKPSTVGLFAACTTHGLSTLHPGMKVTVYLRVPTADPEAGGVNFWAYNSASKAAHAPETPAGTYEPLPATTGWQKYTWTVPAVDTVHSIGVEVDATTDKPVIIWLGAVSW